MSGTPTCRERSELLVELGTEEIPDWMLHDAAHQFASSLVSGLECRRLSCHLDSVWYTPRRIIVGLSEIPVRQDDLEETVTGPPRGVAFDSEGKPTRAAEAFSRKYNVPMDRLRVVATPKGEYLSVVRRVRGERTRVLLERLVPEGVASIQFPKTMHWSPDAFRFARPLRWIVALFQGRPLRFSIAGVAAGRATSGHRFLGARRIRVNSAAELKHVLAGNGVIVDPAERRLRIEEGLAREAEALNGQVLPDPELLAKVVNLNEFPRVIRGSFEERFLALPQEILVTVLREHQKYFSVVDAGGRLLPAFLAVINLDIADSTKIRAGHERVLRARLADAAFFWETDRKIPLASRRESLRSVLFQEKLGSYFDKTERVLRLLPRLAEAAGLSAELVALLQAGSIMKCDLVTEMVKEFTDLQGIVGGLYARSEGLPATIWKSVYEQYMPRSSSSPSPSTPTSALLALADKLDTVCGCFHVGLIPSGSRDPFAVRRQGNGILKTVLDHRLSLSMRELLSWGLEPFAADREVLGGLQRFFEGRLRFLFEETGFSYDCVNAALAAGWDDVVDARERVKALEQMHTEEDFISVASNFKRIVNILAQGSAPDQEPDIQAMSEAEELALWTAYTDTFPLVEAARERHDYIEALRLLASMRKAVDAFFDKVLVMAPEPSVRNNRLALLARLSRLFYGVADLSHIVLDKTGRPSATPGG